LANATRSALSLHIGHGQGVSVYASEKSRQGSKLGVRFWGRALSGKSMVGACLWVLAFLVMAVAVVYQRRLGPTYPLKGSAHIAGAAMQTPQAAGQRLDYSLPRSAESAGDAKVAIPDLGL